MRGPYAVAAIPLCEGAPAKPSATRLVMAKHRNIARRLRNAVYAMPTHTKEAMLHASAEPRDRRRLRGQARRRLPNAAAHRNGAAPTSAPSPAPGTRSPAPAASLVARLAARSELEGYLEMARSARATSGRARPPTGGRGPRRPGIPPPPRPRPTRARAPTSRFRTSLPPPTPSTRSAPSASPPQPDSAEARSAELERAEAELHGTER